MHQNGFYAAMITDTGVQAVFIDEETLYRNRQKEAERQQRRAANAEHKRKIAAAARKHKAGIRVLKQELKLIGMGGILYWGFYAGMVELAFMVPVLLGFQTVICFRAGRWFGRRETK